MTSISQNVIKHKLGLLNLTNHVDKATEAAVIALAIGQPSEQPAVKRHTVYKYFSCLKKNTYIKSECYVQRLLAYFLIAW
jgi:hypothetical protein